MTIAKGNVSQNTLGMTPSDTRKNSPHRRFSGDCLCRSADVCPKWGLKVRFMTVTPCNSKADLVLINPQLQTLFSVKSFSGSGCTKL